MGKSRALLNMKNSQIFVPPPRTCSLNDGLIIRLFSLSAQLCSSLLIENLTESLTTGLDSGCQRGICCRRTLHCCMSHHVMRSCSLDISTCMSLQIIGEVWKRDECLSCGCHVQRRSTSSSVGRHYYCATAASVSFLKSFAHWAKFLWINFKLN